MAARITQQVVEVLRGVEAASIELVVADVSQSQSADAVVLESSSYLSVNDVDQSQALDGGLVLAYDVHLGGVGDVTQQQVADGNLLLVYDIHLVVGDVSQSQVLDQANVHTWRGSLGLVCKVSGPKIGITVR